MNEITIAPGLRLQAPSLGILDAMIDRTEFSASTKRKYKSALTRYVEAGGSLLDADALATYAVGLSMASRAQLKAAVGLWVKQAIIFLKSQATPENEAATQAAIWRLEALQTSIKVKKGSGTKVHIWLTLLEQEKLLAVDTSTRKGQRDNVVLRLLLGAGLRRSEAAGVTFTAVKLMGKMPVLEVMGKGKKQRIIPIGSRLANLLSEWRNLVGDGTILRSVNQREEIGNSLSDVSIFRIVRQYGRAIDKPQLAPHDLRRTFAENLRRNGADIATISTLLGHESVETTMRYLNVNVDLSVVGADFLP